MSSFSTYEQSTFKRKAMLLLSLTPLFISFSKFIISGEKDEWGEVLCFVPFSSRYCAKDWKGTDAEGQ